MDTGRLVNQPINDHVRAEYVTRFHRETWNEVLRLVLECMDVAQLTGLMAQFATKPTLRVRHIWVFMDVDELTVL